MQEEGENAFMNMGTGATPKKKRKSKATKLGMEIMQKKQA